MKSALSSKMAKKFDKLLEAATDSTLLEPNWDGILACADSIRSGEVTGKNAMTSIRKRLTHENPHVVSHALLVLDACVKNCGSKIHAEVATREFMEEFKNLGIENKFDSVKNKVLEMLQCWAMAFANKPEYKIVVDTHNLMKLAGFDFPSIKEADAMFLAQVAPDWQDGTECFRCRSEFGLLTRKHHCRACGQIFCDRCSSKEMPLPQFGIEKEVRVCDACFEKSGKPKSDKSVTITTNGDKKIVSSDVTDAEKEKILREKEEEDLALALAISQSEAEAKDQERQKNLCSMYNGLSGGGVSAPPNDAASVSSYQLSDIGYKGAASAIPESPSEQSLAGDDPLARYLDRDYWQQRKAGVQSKVEEWAGASASAPLPSEPSVPSGANTIVDDMNSMSIEPAGVPAAFSQDIQSQTDATLTWSQEVKEQVGVMESRIRSNTARGRPVVNDTAIQGLFLRLTELHSHVLSRMGKLDEERAYFEGLQDHLAHIVDARSAVTALRQEAEQRRLEEMAELQRKRQSQMKHTLDIMRMKKHAMLLEQRDIALQRFQQQEMQARRPQAPVGYYGQQQPGYQQQQPQQQYASLPPQNYPPYGGYQQPYQPPTSVQQPQQQQQQYAPHPSQQQAPPTQYDQYANQSAGYSTPHGEHGYGQQPAQQYSNPQIPPVNDVPQHQYAPHSQQTSNGAPPPAQAQFYPNNGQYPQQVKQEQGTPQPTMHAQQVYAPAVPGQNMEQQQHVAEEALISFD